MFFAGVTKQAAFNVACKWKRNYRKSKTKEWFLLTRFAKPFICSITNVLGLNVCSVTGGYNLEGCHACKRRLSYNFLLIALAYTCAIIQGIDIRMSKVERYMSSQQREFNAVIAISG